MPVSPLNEHETYLKGKSSNKFHIDKFVKQSRPGKTQPVLVLPAYPADKRSCLMSHLQDMVFDKNRISSQF